MEQKSFVTVFFLLSILILFIPIYVYLFQKWYQLRTHFVLRNRFPNVSIAIVLLSVLTTIVGILELLTNSVALYRIIQLLSCITMGLVFHRVHLIYVRWSIHSKYLQAMTSNADLPKPTYSSSFISHALFALTVVCVPIAMFCTCMLPRGIVIVYQIQVAIGIFHTIRIIRSKASESLDCIKESIISLLCILIMCGLPRFIQPYIPESIDPYSIGGSLATAVVSFCVLYVPIRLIRKVEKSKANAKISGSRVTMSNIKLPATNAAVLKSSPSVTLSPSLSKAPVPSMSPTLSVCTISHSDEAALTHMKCNSREIHITMLKQSLVSFLQTQKHYQLFTGYLSECFALENLMFLERGIILYHMILKCKELDSDFVSTKKESERPKFKQRFYDLSFHYLLQMYADMDFIIQTAVGLNKATDAMKYKRGIVKIMKLIYDGCCSAKSDTQINTSYEVQHNLQMLLEDEDEERLLSKFEDYDDLLNVFHDALVQICDVCDCVYDFQFKSYCRTQNHQI
eukprot:108504_1